MKYKLIFSDFDNTMLRSDLTVGEKTIAAIKDYIARGGHVVVCTGRMTCSINSWREKLGIGDQPIPTVGFAGSHIVDRDDKTLHIETMDVDEVIRMLKMGEELGVYTHFYDTDYVYVAEENDINRNYRAITGAKLKVVGKLSDYLAAHRDMSVVKSMVVTAHTDMPRVVEAYRTLGLKGIDAVTSNPNFLDFTASTAGKGEGLRRVAELLGIPMSETIAVGDNQNDISMIKAAGLGVAVGNALPEVKEIADYVAVPNDQDPIAQIIAEFCGD